MNVVSYIPPLETSVTETHIIKICRVSHVKEHKGIRVLLKTRWVVSSFIWNIIHSDWFSFYKFPYSSPDLCNTFLRSTFLFIVNGVDYKESPICLYSYCTHFVAMITYMTTWLYVHRVLHKNFILPHSCLNRSEKHIVTGISKYNELCSAPSNAIHQTSSKRMQLHFRSYK